MNNYYLQMKKKILLFVVLVLVLLFVPIVFSEEVVRASGVSGLSSSDLKKIEAVVRREVQSSNDDLKKDIISDIRRIEAGVDKTLGEISSTSSSAKIVLVLALAGVVILSETFISFLKFLVYRHKRKLESKKSVRTEKPKTMEELKKDLRKR